MNAEICIEYAVMRKKMHLQKVFWNIPIVYNMMMMMISESNASIQRIYDHSQGENV